LHDYLFYVDRRDQPLYRALAEINHSLGHPPH
jgi:sensor domain CHASE-containing protein